jgi:hypothetical protein
MKMSMARVIEEFQRISGLDGQWEGRVVKEGGPPMVNAILKVRPSVPPAPVEQYVQARVFFGTKMIEGLILPSATEQDAIETALRVATDVKGKWEVQISSEATEKTPRTEVARPVVAQEVRAPLPADLHSFTAIEWMDNKRIGFREISCRRGETPDEQLELVAHMFGKVMEISSWRHNAADGIVEMNVREANFAPLELILKKERH